MNKRFRVAKTVYYETVVGAKSLDEAKLRARTVDWDLCNVGESYRLEEVKNENEATAE